MKNIAANVVYEPMDDTAFNNTIKPSVVWFTGLSGVGKSTVAAILKSQLNQRNCLSCVLDGDLLRQGINKDLGFSTADRSESVRRAGEVARLLVDTGILVIGALISPFEEDRKKVRDLIDRYNFIEVYLHAPMEILTKRDPKGLYRKAQNGEIENFTGITSTYDIPNSPDLHFDTSAIPANLIASEILSHLENLSLEKPPKYI